MIKDILGIGMVIGFCGCFVPQIFKTFKSKSVDGLSQGMVLLALLGNICSLLYQFQTEVLFWNLTKDIVSLIFSVLLLIIYRIYKK